MYGGDKIKPSQAQIDKFNIRFRNHPDFKNRAEIEPFDLWKIRQKHANAFKHWTMEDDKQLIHQLKLQVFIKIIAAQMQRSVGAIAARIEALHNKNDDWGNPILPAVPMCYKWDLKAHGANVRAWSMPKVTKNVDVVVSLDVRRDGIVQVRIELDLFDVSMS